MSTIRCPGTSIQIGNFGAGKVNDCDLESCDDRYQHNYLTIYECEKACINRVDCISYTWAPCNGDISHPDKSVCSLYNDNDGMYDIKRKLVDQNVVGMMDQQQQ